MTFEELKAIGTAMSPQEVADTLHQLTKDRRLAALVRVITDEKDTVADTACGLKFANHHGSLAHAAGARYAWLQLEEKLQAASVPPKKRQPKPPPPPET